MRELRGVLRLLSGSVLATLLVTPVSAQDKWEGYRYATELKDLPFIDYVLDSVVRIESVGSFADAERGPDEIIDVSKRKPITSAKQMPKDRTEARIAWQVETCRKQGLRYCPVMKRSSYGTGFFVEGTRFFTCRHAFHNWLVWAAKANNVPVETLSPPIILRNNNKNAIYNSATVKREELLTFSFLNKDPRLLYVSDYNYDTSQYGAWYAGLTDIVELGSLKTLTKSRSIPLLESYSKVPIGAETYLFGFSAKVDGYDGANVSGRNMTVSNGVVLEPIRNQGGYQATNFFFEGMSGSPMISADGEVLGMSCGAMGMDNIVMRPQDVNAFVMPVDRSNLEQLWSEFDYSLITKQ